MNLITTLRRNAHPWVADVERRYREHMNELRQPAVVAQANRSPAAEGVVSAEVVSRVAGARVSRVWQCRAAVS